MQAIHQLAQVQVVGASALWQLIGMIPLRQSLKEDSNGTWMVCYDIVDSKPMKNHFTKIHSKRLVAVMIAPTQLCIGLPQTKICFMMTRLWIKNQLQVLIDPSFAYTNYVVPIEFIFKVDACFAMCLQNSNIMSF